MNAEQELSEQRSEISRLKKYVELMDETEKNLQAQLQKKDMQMIKLNQGRNWNVEHEKLAMRHIDLQRKYDKIKDESRAMVMNQTMLENEIKMLRSKLKETERECSQQKGEISRLINYVKSKNEESRSLKAQLPEKVIQLLKQKQGRYWKEQVELRHHDLQTKCDKTKYESQAITMDKTKLENEIETLRSKLRKTEQEFLEKANEMSRLKKHVELVDEESNSLRALLHEKDMQLLKQKQGRYWNVEKEQLEMMHNDLQRKFDKIKDESQAMVMDKTKRENEIETLRSKLRKTEQDLSEKTSEISRLKTHVESVDEESKSLKTHLQEKDMLLLEQNQGRNWNGEYEQLETRHKDLQRKFDKIKDESQAMVIDKTKRENEIETLRSKLRKTEQEFLEKANEMSRLKKHVELVDEESNSLRALLHEKDMQLLKQKQGRYWNVEKEQLEMMHNDLQRKFDKIKDESQAMVMDKTKRENEIETLRSMLWKTEQDLSEKTSEISRLKTHVESVDEESKSLKTHLQEKDMLLLEQNQGRNWNGEYEQLETRHKDLQRKFDKIKDESQAMVIDKTKRENEIETLRSKLRKTEQEFLEKANEMSRLKKHVELVDEESNSLRALLHEKDMQLLKQKQGRYWNVEKEQLEMMHNDLQRKFDKIKDESQAMVMDKTKRENEIETLRSMLRKTEQDLSEKTSEIFTLKAHVESVDEESKSLKAQLQEKDMLLLKQNQGRNWNGEYKQLELRHKDLQQKFDKIKDESQAMVMDKTKLENENEKLRSMLRKTELEFSKQKSEINRLKKRLESVDEESKSLIEQLQEKEMQLLNQEDETQAIMVGKTKLENENEKLSAVLKKTEQESLEQKSEISKLKKRVEKIDQELASFKANLQQKETQLQEQRLATKKAYAEKDDALTSLSRHMGQQMSEGNPNITDLSDQNRPSKLGERYLELFDNEWTEAFEGMTDKFDKDDKEVIEVLRTILLESYKRALDFSISQMKEAEYKLSGSTKGVGPECKRLLKDARKHIDIKQADSLLENVLEGTLSKVVDRRYLREAAVQVFAKECFQLCWFMSIQDPPVALVENPIQGSRFDTNMYKHYTNSGDTVDYVVWPALLLHKDGPLLKKGVAQPFPRLTPK